MPLALPTPFLVVLFFVVGVTLGSFGNVLIARLPSGERITGRSRCPRCKRTLTAFELLPLLSFLFLRGQCRGCGKPISLRYPLVELASGFVFLLALTLAGYVLLPALLLGIALWLLFIIAVIDARTSSIHDLLNSAFGISAIAAYYASEGSVAIVAPLVSGGFFLVQWLLSRGKWVGSGDVLLATAIGSLLGDWRLVLVALFVAYIVGSAVAVVLLATHRLTRKDHLPFGPLLALGTVVALVWGEQVLAWVGMM